MSARSFKPAEILTAASVTAVCAVVGVVALNGLSKPDNFEARLAAVTREAETASQLMRAKPLVKSFPAGAVCPSANSANVERITTSLTALAAAQHLDKVNIAVGTDELTRGGLQPLTVHLQAAGPYDAMVGAISHLSELRPMIFIDTVDLSSKTSFVTLSLTGRVFCAAQ